MSAFLKSLILSGIEPLINRALQLDPNAECLLSPLHNKTLAIALTDIGLEFTVLFSTTSITLMSPFEPSADTTLTAPLLSLARFARDPSQSLKPLNIRISGDIQTLRPLLVLLQEVDPDWEEALANHIGDGAAAQVGFWTKQVLKWSNASRQRFNEQTKTFLKFGDHKCVTHTECAEFFNHIDDLNLNTERLELKINRLERQRAKARLASVHQKDNTL